jgi:hypothetical protein
VVPVIDRDHKLIDTDGDAGDARAAGHGRTARPGAGAVSNSFGASKTLLCPHLGVRC